MISTVELLSLDDCRKIRQELEKFNFTDGKNSATGYVKDLKSNYQLESTVDGVAYIFDGIKDVIRKNSYIDGHIMPEEFPRMFANYFSGGHHYNWHVDLAMINGLRTDYSFTLSLCDPKTYEGGELEMQLNNGETMSFKLPEGHMVLYPTGQLHRVTEVTSGHRLSIVGWITSAIGDTEQRHLFGEFVELMDLVKSKYDPDWTIMNKFNQFRQKLLRSTLK